MAEFKTLQETISPKFTKDIVYGILRKKFGVEKVIIDDVILGARSNKGESYLSDVTRFCVNFRYENRSGVEKKEKLHIIVKALLNNVARRVTFRSAEFFKNESIFYEKIWPALDAFQKSKNPKEVFSKIPQCLWVYIDGENDFIAMEDASIKGFKNAARCEGLDLDHIHLILKVFAHFHAIALAYNAEKPKEFEKLVNQLEETYFSERQRKWYTGFQNVLGDITRDAVQKELPPHYLTKLNELYSGDYFGKIVKNCEKRGNLAVVTHGDAWIPNFLISYNENKPQDSVMIDYQLTRCSSLALDLIFFLYCCTDMEFLENGFEQAIDFYIEHCQKHLKDLGSDPNLVTKEKIYADFKEIGPFAIGMCQEGIVMSLLEEDEVSDLDVMEGSKPVPIETVWIVKPLKTKEKRLRLSAMVKHSVDNGFI